MSPAALLLSLVALVVGLAVVARRVGVPYPTLLVLGGLALSVIPGLPRVTLNPDLVFFGFLPPLLFSAGYTTSLRDFRENLRPIGVLAVGLVLATIFGVAAFAHAVIPGVGWPAAFVLGAIVSPTDPVAATAVARRLGVSRRVVTVLEGESVVNDATGLAASRVAVGAAVAGAFSLGAGALMFVAIVAVGALVGVAIGWCAGRLLRLTNDELTTIAITLLTPYAAYLAADALHVSGILGAAAAGLTFRQAMSTSATPRARVSARAVWDVLVFLLNGVLFIITGLELPAVWPSLSPAQHATPLVLVGYGAGVSAVVIAIRLAWLPLATYVGRAPRTDATIVSWAGMRGVLSLAAALGLPIATRTGDPFPARGLILYLTFAVILATLVIQGGTLPALLRRLGASGTDETRREDTLARLSGADAALARLDQLRDRAPAPLIDRLRETYRLRSGRLAAGDATGDCAPDESAVYGWLRREALMAERDAVVRLRDTAAIGDDVLQTIEYELDVEALRLAAAYPIVHDGHDRHQRA